MQLIVGPCPCGHDTQPCTCVQGPKNSPHQLINAMMSCSLDEFLNECNRGSSTVSSTTAPMELAGPAHQGHRSSNHAKPQLRHDRDVIDIGGTQRISQRAGTVGEQLSHPQPARENLYERTTGTSGTVFSNWGMSMVRQTVWTKRNCLCATTVKSTTLTCTTTGMSIT